MNVLFVRAEVFINFSILIINKCYIISRIKGFNYYTGIYCNVDTPPAEQTIVEITHTNLIILLSVKMLKHSYKITNVLYN